MHIALAETMENETEIFEENINNTNLLDQIPIQETLEYLSYQSGVDILPLDNIQTNQTTNIDYLGIHNDFMDNISRINIIEDVEQVVSGLNTAALNLKDLLPYLDQGTGNNEQLQLLQNSLTYVKDFVGFLNTNFMRRIRRIYIE